jgi:predicted CoA-binding protein
MDEANEQELRRIYAETKTIAVVGASTDTSKPAHVIPRYLQSQGFRIVPVNPRGGEILGERVYESLSEVDFPVDVVDVFRPPTEAPQVARRPLPSGPRCCGCSPASNRKKQRASQRKAD